jgi:hypothetical protein
MIIPDLHSNLAQTSFFVFAACDSKYFDEFGVALVNSILRNTKFGIHLHLFNPTTCQLDFCRSSPRISATYEIVPLELFKEAANRWVPDATDPKENLNYRRITTAMRKSNDTSIIERIQKTYFACARFIRLKEITNSTNTFLAIDLDAIVRKDIPLLSLDSDIYLHKVMDKNPRWLAGGIYINKTQQARKFIEEYADTLQEFINNDYLYWGLDQDVLNDIIPKYNWGQLPSELIDWEMLDHSVIWTAKGTRKDLDLFLKEKKAYAF